MPSSPRRLFDDEPIDLARLRDLNLDLEVLVEEIEGVQGDIDKIEGRIELSSGLLKIDRMRFDLVGGNAQLKARVDTRASTPAFMLRVSGDDIDLGDFIAKTQSDIPIDGELDFLVFAFRAMTSTLATSSRRRNRTSRSTGSSISSSI